MNEWVGVSEWDSEWDSGSVDGRWTVLWALWAGIVWAVGVVFAAKPLWY